MVEMRAMDDHDLLEAYASRREEDAFARISERYIGLVYSAALRQTGNSQVAEEITQAVFLTLARKAGSIPPKVILAGWLLRTTRYAAANARRLEQRRLFYEREAMQAQANLTENDRSWEAIAPLLDEAIDRLPPKDRDAVVMRFFQGVSLKQLGETLGIGEDAAQKRVSRAVEKLRGFFDARGRAISLGALMGTLMTYVVQAAPPGLSGSVAAAAVSEKALNLTQATLASLNRAKLQVLALRMLCVLALIGSGFLAAKRFNHDSPSITAAPSAKPASVQNRATVTLPSGLAGETRTLLLRVMDAQTEAPVTYALLTLVSSAASFGRTTNYFYTDPKGIGRVELAAVPAKSWGHRIEVFRDGYVPKFVSWSEHQQDGINEIPSEYTVKVDPALTIGGLVVSEDGSPIPDTQVFFSVTGPIQSRSRERLTMMGDYHFETTDAEGRWRCNHAPRRFGVIDFRPRHPHYQEQTFIVDSPDADAYVKVDRIPEDDFLALRAMMPLKPGLVIGGVVMDEQGQPVGGAKVTQNYDFNRPDRYVFTAADGSFQFRNGRPRELALTAQAAGLAPVVTSIVVNANIDLRLVLPKGRRLHGKVLDESGQPIASASIEAVSPSADSRTLFEWRTKTDVKGHFTWDYAPATQEYAVSASGYETRSRIKLHADSEQIIQLDRKNTLPAVRILGQIIDAQNKQPLTGGRIQIWQTTKEPGGGMSTFTTRAEAAGPDGKFRTKTSSGTLNYVLEAQADGYWPKRLTNDVIGQAEVWLDMEMEKAPLVAGRVLTLAGQAAAGATLVVCGANEWAQLNATGKFQVGRHTTIATEQTDANGRFRLPPTYAPEVVAVAHPEGFVQVPFALMTSNTTLILQPWGGIKGTVRLAGKPLANETIRLIGLPEHVSRTLRVIPTFDVETDAEGRFAFALVPPGEWKVERDINQPERRTLGIRIPVFSHGVRAVVSPGEIATVTLGGHGRPVIGQAIAPTTVAPEIWIENSVTLLLKTAKSERFTYSAMFAPDGSFRIEDVPSGDYVLKIHLAEPPKPAEGNRGRFVPLASLERDVTVLGGTGTFDLGALLLSHAN